MKRKKLCPICLLAWTLVYDKNVMLNAGELHALALRVQSPWISVTTSPCANPN
jgi:hypothetical protein